MSRQQPPGGDRPLRVLLSGPARLVYEKVIDPMRRRARRRVGVQELAQIDDRLLRDIGLTRAEVHGAAYGLLRLGEPYLRVALERRRQRTIPTSCASSAAPSRLGSTKRPPLRPSSTQQASRRACVSALTGKERIMVTEITAWPRKTRELRNQLIDSSRWNEFRFRPDDVVIATYAKSGTTWVQQIVGQLIFGGREGIDVATLSPWLDLRVPPKEVKLAALEAQQHRRFIKTHLPVDALVFSPDARYIYIGRDGRDVVWSLYNHHANVSEDWYRLYNDTPGRVGPPITPPPASIRQYFLEWLEGDGYPFWSFWDNVASWWAIRHLPNVLFLHFADLSRDLPGQIRKVAAFLEIGLDDETFTAAVRHCSFEYMKAHAERCAPNRGHLFKGGAQAFIHKGTNGRWRDVLSAEDCRRYEATAKERLGRRCARWLAEGGSIDQRPRPAGSKAEAFRRVEGKVEGLGPRPRPRTPPPPRHDEVPARKEEPQ